MLSLSFFPSIIQVAFHFQGISRQYLFADNFQMTLSIFNPKITKQTIRRLCYFCQWSIKLQVFDILPNHEILRKLFDLSIQLVFASQLTYQVVNHSFTQIDFLRAFLKGRFSAQTYKQSKWTILKA